jgi:hypothetical protein
MAVYFTCDGCDQKLEPATRQSFGHALKRDYCESCAGEVGDYMQRLDELHTRLSREWAEQVAALRADLAETLPAAKLPDVWHESDQ